MIVREMTELRWWLPTEVSWWGEEGDSVGIIVVACGVCSWRTTRRHSADCQLRDCCGRAHDVWPCLPACSLVRLTSESLSLSLIVFDDLQGNSTLKNISPKINIYDKWVYVSVIKLMMQIRYRRILMIKLPISRNVFLHEGGSSRPSSLFLYVCLFVDIDMVTKNGCSYVLSCVKTCVVSPVWQEIPQSFDPHLQPFLIHNAFINSRSSTVNGAIIYAWVTSFPTSYHWWA